MRQRPLVLTCLVAALAGGCAASRAVAPLPRGEHGITSSLGGPFVQFAGVPIPAPITSVGYRYGIDGKSDVHASLYLTQLALFRVGGFDVGASRELLTADGARPRLMVDLTTYWFFGDRSDGEPKGGFRFFPDVSLVATWDMPHPRREFPHRIYVGVDTFVQPFPKVHVYPSPILGTELRATRGLGVQLEVAWHAFWKDTLFLNPVWYGPGNQGAVAFRLGLNGYFPGKVDAPSATPAPDVTPDAETTP